MVCKPDESQGTFTQVIICSKAGDQLAIPHWVFPNAQETCDLCTPSL